MSSFLLPHLGAVPLRTAFVGSAQQQFPVNTYAPGQIWVARASDAGAQAATTITRARADEPGLRALLEQLDDYQRALYPSASRPPLELDALLQPPARLLVVRDARQQALGCGAVILREDYAELNGMMVLPTQRGRGLGSQLLRALERESVRAGRPLLRLQTGVRQHDAQRLYERLGFRRCGPFGGHRADPFAVFMEKLLG